MKQGDGEKSEQILAAVHYANLVQSQADEMVASLILTNLEFESSRHQAGINFEQKLFSKTYLICSYVNMHSSLSAPSPAGPDASTQLVRKTGLYLAHASWIFLGPFLGLTQSKFEFSEADLNSRRQT